MNTLRHIPFLFYLCFSLGINAQDGEHLFDASYLHELRFYFPQDGFWDSLEYNYHEYISNSGVNIPYTKATLKIDGIWLDTIGIRQKGLSSNYSSTEFKKPFKVDLNEFIGAQDFDGIKKFNLANGSCDPGMMRDLLAYDIMRKAGVRAPRVAFCKLYFNDQYWGLYEIIEQIDKTFVHKNFSDHGGTLIKNIGWSELHWEGPDIQPYLEDFQLKTNEQEDDWSNFLNFVNIINNASDAEFPEAIQQVFDVDLFLHVLAVDIMTNNWDSYIDNERNWYLYHEPAGGQIHWIPWDYNLSLGGDFSFDENPFPPFDTACYIQAAFSHLRLPDGSFQFTDKTLPEASSWTWEFSDGGFSFDQNPTHFFDNEKTVEICLTVRRLENGNICENKRCQKINVDFNPGECNSIVNGTSPFAAYDPIFQMVIQQDEFCCENEWDASCTLQYVEIAQGNSGGIGSMGSTYNLDFQLILEDTAKILVDRLMKVPEFRERYLDICCYILENNFNEERLFPMIEAHKELIQDAKDEDPNFIYSHDYFEYDLGNGTGGGNGAEIPPLKFILSERFAEMANDLQNVGHDCSEAFCPIGFNDLVINEFMASVNEQSENPDPAGEYEDWIELYNNTGNEIDLKNFYLSDNLDKQLKWTFPFGTVIQPFGYLIVWADKDEGQDGVHANFKLSKNGESIMLRHEDGTVIDVVNFMEQQTNIASARMPNGVGPFIQQAPTFAGNNGVTNNKEIINGKNILIYPNPANRILNVELNAHLITDDQLDILIKNPLGQIVFFQKLRNINNKINLDINSLATGCYFIEIKNGDEIHWVEKLVIHRNE